jgi:uracil-DNA glycosylase
MATRVDSAGTADARHDPGCARCARIVALRARIRAVAPEHHAGPVAGAGRPGARLLIVGLAPGRMGANRTGIPFQGDSSGAALWAALLRSGLRPDGTGAAGDWRIVNALKCLPPANRPSGAELANCRGFLRAELAAAAPDGVVLMLGRTAHTATLAALGLPARAFAFAHAAYACAGTRMLIASYHPSRYNFATGRLEQAALDAVVARAVRFSRNARARPGPPRRA